jgi:hypothetical protein
MSNVTVKIVADVEPSLKQAFDRRAKRDKLTKRAALEQAMRLWLNREGKQ